MNVELRHLRSFLVLAGELNFTRAAARLHVAQQALSASIRQLEEELGTELFVRTTRKVELTASGRALLERAPAVLAQLDSTLAEIRGIPGGQLTLGLLATSPLDFTPRLLRSFSAERPMVKVSIRNVAFDDPTGGVRDRSCDAALVWEPFETSGGLVCEPLFSDERVAVMAADHPLASRENVTPEELAAESFVWVGDMDPVARDYWTLASYRQGRPAKAGAQITGLEDLFAAIRAGQAVSASPVSVARTLPWTDLVIRPVPGLAPAVVSICWRPGECNPLVEALVACASRLAGLPAAGDLLIRS